MNKIEQEGKADRLADAAAEDAADMPQATAESRLIDADIVDADIAPAAADASDGASAETAPAPLAVRRVTPPATPRATSSAAAPASAQPVVATRAARGLQGPAEMAPRGLGPAPIIYGVAGAGLIVLALFYIFSGAWLTGLILLVPAGCLIGFAYVYLR